VESFHASSREFKSVKSIHPTRRHGEHGEHKGRTNGK
jgi:hypothetical protein